MLISLISQYIQFYFADLHILQKIPIILNIFEYFLKLFHILLILIKLETLFS